jgi:hypothetical protein
MLALFTHEVGRLKKKETTARKSSTPEPPVPRLQPGVACDAKRNALIWMVCFFVQPLKERLLKRRYNECGRVLVFSSNRHFPKSGPLGPFHRNTLILNHSSGQPIHDHLPTTYPKL